MGKKKTSSGEIWFFRIVNYVVMVLIVGTLCAVAFPKSIINVFDKNQPIAAAQPQDLKQRPVDASNKNQGHGQVVDAAAVAKLAIDNTQAAIAGVREDQKQIFSVIAAIAALLVFLGFKGVDSFHKAHQSVLEAEEKAEEFKVFVERRYKLDGRASFDLFYGVIRRELADLCREANMDDLSKDLLCKAKGSLMKATSIDSDHEESVDIKSRAYGVLGNVYYRLKQYSHALDCQERIIAIEKPDSCAEDQVASEKLRDAYFNSACYLSKLAEEEATNGNQKEAHKYGLEAIDNLVIFLDAERSSPSAKLDIKNETDFEYLRVNFSSDYQNMIS